MASILQKVSPGMRLYWAALVASIAAFLSVFIAFCSPYWYQSWRRVHSPLSNVGLWHICLSGYTKPRDPSMQSYVGCWWIHSTFFSDVVDFIMPPWFRGCQALAIFTVLCNLVGMILLILYLSEGARRRIYADRYVLIFIINAALMFAAGFMVFIVSIVFAMFSRQENYFPRPWMNYLSWSYGFNVLSGFFSAFAGICLFIMAMILKDKLFEPDARVEKEMKGGTSEGSGSIITGPSVVSGSMGAPSSKVGESFV